MNRLLWAGLIWLLAAAPGLAALPSAVEGQPLPSLAPMLERTTPAVVNIATRGKSRRKVELPLPRDPLFRRFFDVPSIERVQETASLGSGVIVDAENGLILTNHHVIQDAYEIKVTLTDGRELAAEVAGLDPDTDVAVLRIASEDLVQIPFADSSDLRVGDFVVAIGNPFGLGQTVTSGIVSALGRSGLGIESIEDFIQTDASINPGNSGGALVNMRGELVGINSAIISRTGGNVGIGFAVPSEIAQSIMRQILDFGEVRRGLLGVTIQTLDQESAEVLGTEVDRGALITGIEPGSAADDAGLRVDDIIVGVDDTRIDNHRELANAIGLRGSGDSVQIDYYRDGRQRTVTAELGQRMAQQISGDAIHPGLDGASFATASATANNGVEVASVEADSAAAQRGLRAGDIITAVNRQPVQNLQQLREVASSDRILFLLVRRGDRQLMLQIR